MPKCNNCQGYGYIAGEGETIFCNCEQGQKLKEASFHHETPSHHKTPSHHETVDDSEKIVEVFEGPADTFNQVLDWLGIDDNDDM